MKSYGGSFNEESLFWWSSKDHLIIFFKEPLDWPVEEGSYDIILRGLASSLIKILSLSAIQPFRRFRRTDRQAHQAMVSTIQSKISAKDCDLFTVTNSGNWTLLFLNALKMLFWYLELSTDLSTGQLVDKNCLVLFLMMVVLYRNRALGRWSEREIKVCLHLTQSWSEVSLFSVVSEEQFRFMASLRGNFSQPQIYVDTSFP